MLRYCLLLVNTCFTVTPHVVSEGYFALRTALHHTAFVESTTFVCLVDDYLRPFHIQLVTRSMLVVDNVVSLNGCYSLITDSECQYLKLNFMKTYSDSYLYGDGLLVILKVSPYSDT